MKPTDDRESVLIATDDQDGGLFGVGHGEWDGFGFNRSGPQPEFPGNRGEEGVETGDWRTRKKRKTKGMEGGGGDWFQSQEEGEKVNTNWMENSQKDGRRGGA